LHDDPLGPQEFLSGRRQPPERAPRFPGHWAEPDLTSPAPTSHAWTVLGVPPGTTTDEIKRAYRRLARTVHPDLHPHATDDERRALEARFAEITDAYRQLVA
jgi:DnaJ-class molecular chaperone